MIELQNISKSFDGVSVLDNISTAVSYTHLRAHETEHLEIV